MIESIMIRKGGDVFAFRYEGRTVQFGVMQDDDIQWGQTLKRGKLSIIESRFH